MTDGPNAAFDISGDPPPEPAKQKRGRGKKILLWTGAVVLVLLVGFGVLVAIAVDDVKEEFDQAASLQAGQCASVTKMGTTNPGLAPVDCTAADANYRVGARLAGATAACPAGDYDVYQQGARIGQDVTLCLIPNVVKGKCYLLNDAGTGPAACKPSAGAGHIRIDQVLTGSTDKTKCGKNSNLVLTYSQPATVLCARTL